MSLNIVFEDQNLLVINKSAGMVVNRSDTTGNVETLQDMVQSRVDLKKGSEEFLSRGGIVHRLDRETSGLLLVAKNQESFDNLQAQFKNREVKKEYIALAHGEVVPKKSEINVPVGRLPWNRTRFGVLAGGRQSLTEYEVIEERKHEEEILSLLVLKPKTGRTHQIRVHLKYINHPIFSDFMYAGRKVSRKDRKILDRVFLHASSIKFKHPVTGKDLSFAIPLAEELRETLKLLKFEYNK